MKRASTGFNLKPEKIPNSSSYGQPHKQLHPSVLGSGFMPRPIDPEQFDKSAFASTGAGVASEESGKIALFVRTHKYAILVAIVIVIVIFAVIWYVYMRKPAKSKEKIKTPDKPAPVLEAGKNPKPAEETSAEAEEEEDEEEEEFHRLRTDIKTPTRKEIVEKAQADAQPAQKEPKSILKNNSPTPTPTPAQVRSESDGETQKPSKRVQDEFRARRKVNKELKEGAHGEGKAPAQVVDESDHFYE